MAAAAIAILFVLWLMGFLFLWRAPIPGDALDETGDTAASIIIPARNEERSLPALLASLGAQSPSPAEVIVVDDHSEDRTAALAREAGARVLPAAALPEGWLGKPWACWQGAQASRGQTLVFLDADTRLLPGGLRRILAQHRRVGGLLSVWPYHRMVHLYERLSALFNVVVLASMRCFTIWGRRLAPLGAFGPCVVCSRGDYFAVGGHQQARGAVLEDVALGQAFRQAGREIHNYVGRGSIEFRMYPDGLGSLVEGFGKNVGAGAGLASPAVLVPLIGWITGCFIVSVWLPWALAADILARGAAGAPSLWAAPFVLAALGALYALHAAQIFWMLRRLGSYGAATALLFPVPLVFFAGVFFLSLTRTHLLRRVRWKGRDISTQGG